MVKWGLKMITRYLLLVFVVVQGQEKTCQDKKSYCNVLKKSNYCKLSARFIGFMKNNCAKSCRFCSPYGCVNFKTNRYCTIRKSYCDKSSKYFNHMKHFCQKTCGLCSGGLVVISESKCGDRPKKMERGIGLLPAYKNGWPWQVGINSYGTIVCGGTLIDRQWVLTASQCIDSRYAKVDDITVSLGDHDRKKKENTEVVAKVSKIINHPKYTRGKLVNDIALIKLTKPVKLSTGINLPCLPKQGKNVTIGKTCYITGWGTFRHPGSSYNILHEVGVPVVSDSNCNKIRSEWGGQWLTKKMICAGDGPGSSVFGCFGDSGGPLVCYNRRRKSWTIEGALSWGSSRCNDEHKFTVFTKVSEYIDWIHETIKNN